MGAGVLQQKVPIWHRVLFDGIYGLCQVVPNQSLLASRKVGTPVLLESRNAAPCAFMDNTATLLSSAAQKSYCELGRKGLKTRSHEG